MSSDIPPGSAPRVGPRPAPAPSNGTPIVMDHLVAFLESDDGVGAGEVDPKTAPLSLVLEMLEAEGVPPRTSLEDYGLSRDVFLKLEGQPDAAPLLPRMHLARRLRDALLEEGILVVTGGVRSGKTTLLRQFISDPACMRPYERSFVLDCFALRGSDPNAIDREALWSFLEMWEGTAPAVRRGAPFWRRVSAQESKGSPLTTQILALLNGRGLLVLDHLNHLSRDLATERWLSCLIKSVREAGNHVVASYTTAEGAGLPHERAFSDVRRIEVEGVPRCEVATWLLAPFFEAHTSAGLTAGQLHLVTGGRPGLLRDFAVYLATEANIKDVRGTRALVAFGKLEASSYSVECDHLVQALRRYPELLIRSGGASGRGRLAALRVLLQSQATLTKGKGAREDILATGAVFEAAGGDLVFASPIFARRFLDLTAPQNLVLMLGSNDPETTLASSRLVELLGVPLRAALLAEQSSNAALVQFAHCLICLGLTEVRIYLRDQQNARLWSLHRTVNGTGRAENGAWPLSAEERPEFSMAVSTGRRVVAGQSIFLPVIGPQGRVELVATGLLSKSLCGGEKGYRRLLTIRMVWNFVLNLQPSLALVIERLRARRSDNLQRQLFHRVIHTKNADPVKRDHVNMALREANCSAVAILERNPSQWFVADAGGVGKSGAQGRETAELGWEKLLEGSSTAELDDITSHPSDRGLVLSGTDLDAAFPRLQRRSDPVALFLRPVWMHSGAACRIVVFVFEGAASKTVSGARQVQLSVVAPFALH